VAILGLRVLVRERRKNMGGRVWGGGGGVLVWKVEKQRFDFVNIIEFAKVPNFIFWGGCRF
jgi:ribulose 1,5-bisphosphate synthetase/thiazole synthase